MFKVFILCPCNNIILYLLDISSDILYLLFSRIPFSESVLSVRYKFNEYLNIQKIKFIFYFFYFTMHIKLKKNFSRLTQREK